MTKQEIIDQLEKDFEFILGKEAEHEKAGTMYAPGNIPYLYGYLRACVSGILDNIRIEKEEA